MHIECHRLPVSNTKLHEIKLHNNYIVCILSEIYAWLPAKYYPGINPCVHQAHPLIRPTSTSSLLMPSQESHSLLRVASHTLKVSNVGL